MLKTRDVDTKTP